MALLNIKELSLPLGEVCECFGDPKGPEMGSTDPAHLQQHCGSTLGHTHKTLCLGSFCHLIKTSPARELAACPPAQCDDGICSQTTGPPFCPWCMWTATPLKCRDNPCKHGQAPAGEGREPGSEERLCLERDCARFLPLMTGFK